MKKEKTKIYVEFDDMKLEVYLDTDLVEGHGGIESVQKYVRGSMAELYGDLMVPNLKPIFNQINILNTQEKLRVIREARESEKGLSKILN